MINWNNWADEGIVTKLVIDNLVESPLSSWARWSPPNEQRKIMAHRKWFYQFREFGIIEAFFLVTALTTACQFKSPLIFSAHSRRYIYQIKLLTAGHGRNLAINRESFVRIFIWLRRRMSHKTFLFIVTTFCSKQHKVHPSISGLDISSCASIEFIVDWAVKNLLHFF